MVVCALGGPGLAQGEEREPPALRGPSPPPELAREVEVIRLLGRAAETASADLDAAEALIQRAITLDEERTLTYYEAGLILERPFSLGRGASYLRRYLAMETRRDRPEWALTHLKLGAQALARYRDLLYTANEPAIGLSAQLVEAERHLRAARDELRRVDPHHPQLGLAERDLILVSWHRGDYEATLRYARSYVSRHGHDGETLERMASALIELDRADEALATVQRYMLPDPLHANQYRGDLFLHLLHARCAYAAGDLAEALRILDDLEDDLNRNDPLRLGQGERRPDLAMVYTTRAGLHFNDGDYGEAERYYRRAHDADPRDATGFNNLAWAIAVSAEQGDARLAEALVLSEQALARERNPTFLDTLAEVHARMGHEELAIEAIDEALLVTPESDPLHAYYERQRQRFVRARSGHALSPGGGVTRVRFWSPQSSL